MATIYCGAAERGVGEACLPTSPLKHLADPWRFVSGYQKYFGFSIAWEIALIFRLVDNILYMELAGKGRT